MKTVDCIGLGDFVSRVRSREVMTQQEFADKIGVNVSVIQRIENNYNVDSKNREKLTEGIWRQFGDLFEERA